jgi:hypothetical protein
MIFPFEGVKDPTSNISLGEIFLRCIVQDEKDKLIFNNFFFFFFFDSHHINESKHIKYFTMF